MISSQTSSPTNRIFPDYPSYELYTTTLRNGVFKPRDGAELQNDESWKGRQLRLVVDKQRRVSQVIRI